jgi:thymidylate kinase
MKFEKQIICIVGLPGSGKTTLARKMKKYGGGILLDDLKNIIWLKLVMFLGVVTIYVTHPNLCLARERKSFEQKIKEINPNYKISWMFFENNPENCWKNVQARKDKRNISKNEIKYYYNNYFLEEPGLPVLDWSKNEKN